MTPGYLNTVQGMTQLYEIQSSSEIELSGVGQNKWRYVVKPATLQTMTSNTAPVKGLSSDETFLTGWNVYESENTATDAMGINPATSSLPAAFELYPIPVGRIVPGWYYQGGDQLCVFIAWPNQFDGACDP